MEEVQITNISKDDQNLIKFDIKNIDVSFVNAIRRLILSEVETAGFNTMNYNDSNIKIIENTSSLHNEFILHRIGLIPIYNIDDPSNYRFELNIQNNTNKSLDVTTKDFKVIDTRSNQILDSLKFFPPDPITGDNILIIRLKSNPGGEGEKLHLEGVCSIGSGSIDSRFSPVSNLVYVNKIDREKFNSALVEHLNSFEEDVINNPEKRQEITKTFEINELQRYFFTDSEGNPNLFEFTIESIGVMPSHVILLKSLEKLKFKLASFINNLKSDNLDVSIKESPTVMTGFDIVIKNENHTLGSILQSYLNKHEKVNFVGYKNPHPLIKEIIVRVSTETNTKEDLITVCDDTVNNLNILIDKVGQIINTEFNLVEKPKQVRKRLIRKPKS